MSASKLFEKASGKEVFVKTAMDRAEYLASGYYVETLRQSFNAGSEIEDADFFEVDESENEAVKEAFASGEKSIKAMNKEELRAEYERVLGKKPAGALSEAKMIKEIEVASNDNAE